MSIQSVLFAGVRATVRAAARSVVAVAAKTFGLLANSSAPANSSSPANRS